MDGVTVKLVSPLSQPLEAFALNSWLLQHERLIVARPHYNLGRRGFYRVYKPEILRLLRTNRVAVAALTEDPDVFLGWACGAPGVLHYVYVKHAARRVGLANELMREVCGTPKVYTFEPCDRRGDARDDLLAVAKRKGMQFREHRIGWRYNAAGIARITQPESEQR